MAGSVGPYGAFLHDGSEYTGAYAEQMSVEVGTPQSPTGLYACFEKITQNSCLYLRFWFCLYFRFISWKIIKYLLFWDNNFSIFNDTMTLFTLILWLLSELQTKLKHFEYNRDLYDILIVKHI